MFIQNACNNLEKEIEETKNDELQGKKIVDSLKYKNQTMKNVGK